ncbi:MAG: YncE family protein, partial [Mesorhizobium sp.]
MIRTVLRHAGLAPVLLLALLPARTLAGSCLEDCGAPSVNVYSHTTAGHLSPATAGALPRVYVPNRSSNSVSVIDTTTLKEVDRFSVGSKPQHVVPSWDLKTLWVANNGTGKNGSLTEVDPKTGKPSRQVPVDDPYNMYFMPDGSSAIIVDEALRQLDLRDPATMALKS